MLRIGITGGTACGKSTVVEMLRELSAQHPEMPALFIDADKLVHELYAPGQKVTAAVADAFGKEVLAADGAVDRKKLAAIALQDKDAEKLRQLESIVHPAVVEREHELIDAFARRQPHGIAFVEAAKMLEAGTYQAYDKVLLVTCHPDAQWMRFRQRHPAGSEQDAKSDLDRRIRAQMPEDQRRSLIDEAMIIDNSGAAQQTRAKVERIFTALLHEATKK